MVMTDVARQKEAGSERGQLDRRMGKVVSARRDKSIKVRFEFSVKHPKYGKYMRRSTTLHTHDEKNEAKTGDIVEVVACRRLSKTKCWRLERIVRSASPA